MDVRTMGDRRLHCQQSTQHAPQIVSLATGVAVFTRRTLRQAKPGHPQLVAINSRFAKLSTPETSWLFLDGPTIKTRLQEFSNSSHLQ